MIYQVIMAYNKIYTTNNIDIRWCVFTNLLNLTHTDLSEVSHDYFINLGRLIFLDLSFNNLTYLHNDIFITNCKLSRLYMNNNGLKLLPNLQCMSKLKRLELQFNRIETIENLINGSTPELAILLLNQNRIKTLKHLGLSKLVHLNELDVSNNEIETLVDCGFESLYNLAKLDISNNLIKSFTGIKFNMVKFEIMYTSLKNFSLTAIRAIRESIAPQVKKETVTKYYKALFLNDRDYINCELSLYFIKYQIHFNFFTDNQVNLCLNELTKINLTTGLPFGFGN